ncbi:MAG: hypothetical protein HY869_07960 [Chloroflexi bacterium]|nr:hypothetical protein [Chloroflexota bacterium]
MKNKKLFYTILLIVAVGGIFLLAVWQREWIGCKLAVKTPEDKWAEQTILAYIEAQGLDIHPCTDRYNALLKGILLGDVPELIKTPSTFIKSDEEGQYILVYASENFHTPQELLFPNTTEVPASEAVPPTASIQQEKQAILQEIYTLVDQYNAFLEKEKATGNYMIVQLSDGSEGVQFTNESAWKVFTEMGRVDKLIADLNEKYYELSVKEYPSMAYPNPDIPSDPGRLNIEYPAWLDKEFKNGSKVILVTDFGEKRSLLVGDSYVEQKQWEQQFDSINAQARQAYFASIDAEPDFEIIRRIEGADVQITFKDVSHSPYRTDKPYTLYETATMRYTLDSTQHLVVGISPITKAQHANGLSVPELEKLARDMIALVSPEINLDVLEYSFNQKEELSFFFRWEDLTKPLLDDGRSYPFVQVGLTGKGELLNYVNTLSMSR